MYLQEIIEVVIGLIFAWLLLSIAVLQIQEVVARLTSKRSNDLYNAIGNMLNDPNVLEEFYKHPLVESLKTPPSGVRDWFKKIFSKKVPPFQNPSYIPAEIFAKVLFDITTKAGTKDSSILVTFHALREVVEKLSAGDRKTANDLIFYLVNLGNSYASTQANELQANLEKEMLIKLDELEKVGTDSTGYQPLAKFANVLKAYVNGDRANEIAFLLGCTEPYISRVRRGALIYGSKQLGMALNSLLAGVEEYATNTDKAIAIGRRNVETWFDSTMERVTGLYKRWAQVWAFVIGLILAVALNIDSIYIARELWRNPAIRQTTAVYIENFVAKKTQNGAPLTDFDLQIIDKEIQKLAYPVGWNEYEKQILNDIPGVNMYELYSLPWAAIWAWFYLGKMVGWLITAFAAMQGAPFWFDTLKKLVNVRSSGANPAEKPKESTSDKER